MNRRDVKIQPPSVMRIEQILRHDKEAGALSDRIISAFTAAVRQSLIAAAHRIIVRDRSIFCFILHSPDRHAAQASVKRKQRYRSLKIPGNPEYPGSDHRNPGISVEHRSLPSASQDPGHSLDIRQRVIEPSSHRAVDQEILIASADPEPCRCHCVRVVFDHRQLKEMIFPHPAVFCHCLRVLFPEGVEISQQKVRLDPAFPEVSETAVYRDGSGRVRVVIESGRLAPLLREADYLERLSQAVGVRLCQPEALHEDSARLTLLEAEPLAVSVGIAALKKRGETVSGDRGSYFKTDAGVLCVLLSDGMGTGSAAAEDSARVVKILEKFLRSGVDPALAMKILNSVLLLRGGDGWGCATVDLMCVDLFSGETCFYKYGAAPSFIKSAKGIRRIEGESFAAGLPGLEGTAPDMVRMRLKPGSLAVIASDGVLADQEDSWLKVLLSEERTDMKQLARSILRAAEKLYGASDDMTVLTVRVEERA